MFQEIRVHWIRAYEDAKMVLPSNRSVLFGSNGTGKTTLLEAVQLIATARSFRTAQLREVIQSEKKEGWVQAQTQNPDSRRTLHLEILHQKLVKTLTRDGHPAKNVSSFTQGVATVVLAPEHLLLVSGPPQERRKYLDQLLFVLSPPYLETAKEYQRAVHHKQALLKQGKNLSDYVKEVQPWNLLLASKGDRIRVERKSLTETLLPWVQKFYEELSQDRREISIHYACPKESLWESLLQNEKQEFFRKRLLCGPHLDDVKIFLNQQPASPLLSQGEKASVLLALKLSEQEVVRGKHQKNPTLIFDDVGTTLDSYRRNKLFEKLSMEKGQTLISTSNERISEEAKNFGCQLLLRKDEKGLSGFSFANWVPA